MADNYLDIPILCVKLKGKAACTAGYILKGGDTGGWAKASAANAACGVYALEDIAAYDSAIQTGAGWGTCLIMGTFWGTAADTIDAGCGVRYSDTAGKVAQNADSTYMAIGTAIDGAAAATTRTTRILFFGTPTNMNIW